MVSYRVSYCCLSKDKGFAYVLQIENHTVNKNLMEKVKNLVNSHYENNLKVSFYESDVAKELGNGHTSNVDWESSFFISHRPKSNIHEFQSLSEDLR